jgi:chromosome segregation ATPase
MRQHKTKTQAQHTNMRSILSPELASSGFTVRSINKDADAVTTTSKGGKKRLRWAKQLEHIQVIPSRFDCQPMCISDLEIKIQQMKAEISVELTRIEQQTKTEEDLEDQNDHLLNRYSTKLEVVQLKQTIESIESEIEVLDMEISSMRLDRIQWKGQQLMNESLLMKNSSQRRRSYEVEALKKGEGSLRNLWSGATAVINKSWATCA